MFYVSRSAQYFSDFLHYFGGTVFLTPTNRVSFILYYTIRVFRVAAVCGISIGYTTFLCHFNFFIKSSFPPLDPLQPEMILIFLLHFVILIIHLLGDVLLSAHTIKYVSFRCIQVTFFGNSVPSCRPITSSLVFHFRSCDFIFIFFSYYPVSCP